MTEFVFTITQGRTGTKSLSELFKRHDPEALTIHEHLDPNSHGTFTPDVGQMRRFNTYGLTPPVAAFWKTKLAIIRKEAERRGIQRYVETAHMNAKCGLVEYVLSAERGSEDRFRFIILNRAPEKIARSLCEQGGLRHLESMWLWYLDPAYPKNRVDPAPYLVHGYLGRVAWYVREVEARKSVYRSMLLGGQFDVLTVTVEQPDWAETVCQAYGLSLPAGAEPILANRNKPKAERTELERRLRVLFDSIPASARADELVDGI